MSYDTKCLNLALDFMRDHPEIPVKKADELAQEIQTTIEDWIRDVLETQSGEEALAEYPKHKAEVEKEQEQEECPHDEHDHGICLECGKDIMDDLIGRAELLRDE